MRMCRGYCCLDLCFEVTVEEMEEEVFVHEICEVAHTGAR